MSAAAPTPAPANAPIPARVAVPAPVITADYIPTITEPTSGAPIIPAACMVANNPPAIGPMAVSPTAAPSAGKAANPTAPPTTAYAKAKTYPDANALIDTKAIVLIIKIIK